MSKKIFYSIVVVAMAVLTASLVITNGYLYDYFNKTQIERLKEELTLASVGVEAEGREYFDNFTSSLFRFTLISSMGEVLYDSQASYDKMENHIDREEIAEALESGTGDGARYSQTLTERTFYEAKRLKNGDVLRISATQMTIASLVMRMMPAICAIITVCLILSVLLSKKMAKSIVRPLEALDLDSPENNDTYEELTPLLSRLEKQHKQIEKQLRELEYRKAEFRQITSSMKEGLILLDKSGRILSINDAAVKLFNTEKENVGNDILHIDRSEGMRRAVDKALGGEHSEFHEQRDGREYAFMITPSLDGETLVGTVVLCIDVTEAVNAQRNRQEFTSNVSHELKTPLQAIIGSAELLERGLVKQEDTARFIGNIKNEAERLVALINDIIHLSELDEEKQVCSEVTRLDMVINDTLEQLAVPAEKKGVKLSADAEPCTIKGRERYVHEIVYNLCDNAIRYNKTGGTVHVTAKKDGGGVMLTVADNGIGIGKEHCDRIFERFYRVDKSHSRQTGGTGLGLSIVKHAVERCSGTIKLDSTLGEGTTVTVIFNEN